MIAKLLSDTPDVNHLQDLKDTDLYSTFKDLYKLDTTNKEANLLVSFLIFAYDPDSLRLNIRKDRYENKQEILKSLGLDIESELISDIARNENESFTNSVTLYLEKLTDWRWPTIYSLLDYHSSMIRFTNQKTETEKKYDKISKDGESKLTISKDIDMETISKINIQKSELLKKAISAREDADKLLEEIRKAFMPTDTVTAQDFGFTFTETAKKIVNIYSWREFIKTHKESVS